MNLNRITQSHLNNYQGRNIPMNTNRMNRWILGLGIAVLMALAGIAGTSRQAEAALCVNNFQVVTCDTVTGNRPSSSSSSSCLSVMTDTRYEFRVTNATGNRVHYSINETSFNLNANSSSNHSFRRAYGTNSCNVQTYPNPRIEFDSSYASGYQERSYRIGDHPQYTFRVSGNGLNLYNSSSSTSSTGSVSTSSGSGATLIAYGARRNDSVTSSSGDRWTFRGSAGDWVEITMSSNNMDSYLELYAPNGQRIASNDDGGSNLNSRIYLSRLPQSGIYTIVARGFEGDTGTYRLTLD